MPDDDKFQKERFNPALPHCNTISLRYNGVQLTMAGVKPEKSYHAVSGKLKYGRFDNSVSRQQEGNAGPIPAGTYWINPDELWANAFYKDAAKSAWGDFRITIHPFTTTETFKRGGFFIHGGAVAGSAGCIDLTNHMNKVVEDLKEAVGDNKVCQIHLTVKY